MAEEELTVKIGADISGFSKGISQTQKDLSGLGKEGSNGVLSLGKLAGALGLVTLAGKGLSMIKDSVQQAFGRIDTMEQFDRVMTTLTGSSEKASQTLDKVNDTVTGTAYGLDVAAKSTQDFVTSGMDVDKATTSIASWGDAVAFYGEGSNESFASVTDALAKMTAKGKVQMDTMNRLTEAGIPAMQIYADATGQSVEEVAETMSKGGLDAEEFMDVMNDALENGTEKFAGIGGAAKEAGASWGASFDNMRAAVARGVTNIIQNIDEMLTQNGLPDMREMVSSFGSMFEDVLTRIGDFIPPVLQGIISVYEKLKPWMPLIQAVLVAVGSLLTIVGVMNTVAGAFAIAKTAVSAFGKSMLLANLPITIIVGAIAGLAFLIYKYWDEIVAVTTAVWTTVKDFFIDFWESTKEIFTNVITSIVDFITEMWTNIKEFTVGIWQGLVDGVMAILEPFIEGFMNIFNNMRDGLTEIFEGLKLYFEGVWEIIKNIFLGAVLLLINLVTGNFTELKENALAIWENLKDGFSMVWEGIQKVFSGALSAIFGYLTGIWENISSTTTTIFSNISSFLSGIWSDIKSFFTETLSNIWNTVVQKFQDIVSSVRQKMTDVKNKITDGWNNALEFLKGIDLLQIGKDIINGLVQGIKDKVNAVKDAVKDVASAITGKIKGILGIGSPSRILRDIGKDTGEGLYEGLDSMMGKVSGIAQELAEEAIVNPDSVIDIGYARPDRLQVAGGGTIDQSNLSGGLGGEQHVHYWNIDAEEISDVQQLINVVDGVVQSVRSR